MFLDFNFNRFYDRLQQPSPTSIIVLAQIAIFMCEEDIVLIPLLCNTSRPRYHQWLVIFYMIKCMIRCAYSIQQDTHSRQSVSKAGLAVNASVKSEECIVTYDKHSAAPISVRARE